MYKAKRCTRPRHGGHTQAAKIWRMQTTTILCGLARLKERAEPRFEYWRNISALRGNHAACVWVLRAVSSLSCIIAAWRRLDGLHLAAGDVMIVRFARV